MLLEKLAITNKKELKESFKRIKEAGDLCDAEGCSKCCFFLKERVVIYEDDDTECFIRLRGAEESLDLRKVFHKAVKELENELFTIYIQEEMEI